MFLTIIIPLAPGDSADVLINQLQKFGYEPIVVTEETRAKSLNRGARLADGEYLLFLHADTNLDNNCLKELPEILKGNTDRMYYFKLKFNRKGLVYLNSLLTNLRCYFFSLPYGDQGFCIPKKLFFRAGGFPEYVCFGEDMYFVLKLKQLGKSICRLPFSVTTSARRYQQQGWLKVTLMHQWRFWKILYDFKFTKDKEE